MGFTAVFVMGTAVFAQDTSGAKKGLDDKASAQDGPGLKIELGYRRTFGNDKDTTFYKIALFGETLTEKGKAFTDAQGFTEAVKFRNDAPKLQLTIDRGVPELDGPLTKYLQLGNLPRTEAVRIVAQGYGTLGGESPLGFAVGVETLPLFVPIPSVPNYITIGVQGGTQPLGGTTANPTSQQDDVGVVAYRQFLAYAPLNRFSQFRANVRAFAKALPDNVNVSLSDFYRGVIEGKGEILQSLATTPDAQKALEKLSDAERKALVEDLRFAAPFSVGKIPAPDSVGETVRKALASASTGTPLAKIKAEFDKVAAIPVPRPLPNWTMDDKEALMVAERFVASGGMSNAADLNEAKKFLTDMGLPSLNPAIAGLVEIAFKQTVPNKKKAFLVVANRLFLESALTEIAAHGVVTSGMKDTLENLYTYKDRSSFVFLVENTGQYYFAGEDGNGSKSRLNHLFAGTATFYVNPEAQSRGFLRFRYENGRDRAAPTVYLNQLTITVGIEL
jgi:hypothetical protein